MPMSVLVKKIVETTPLYTEMFEGKSKIYTFLNPVSYLEALKNKALFEQFDGIFVDGIFLAIAIRLVYHKRINRCSFDMTALAPELFYYSQVHNKSLYIIAGKQEEVERTISIFKEHYPRLNIVGCRNGYFREEKDIDVEILRIIAKKPDFVICGMGVVKQEHFLFRLKSAGYSGVAFTCGGFISQTAKAKITYYPKLFDALNLRFVYRMIKEKHTRKRYIVAMFCFPIKFVKEWLTSTGNVFLRKCS